MSSIDWLALAPLLVLSGGAVFMMILVSITRNLGSAWLVALATTLGAALACHCHQLYLRKRSIR